MGKGKLEKFADMRDYPHVFEYPYSVVDNVPFGCFFYRIRSGYHRSLRLLK